MDANIISQSVGVGINNLVNNPISLIIGIVLIALTILFLVFFKNFILNSIIGIAGFIFCTIIGIKLPFWLTIIISGIFGLAGLGIMLILKFFGLV
ncbi:MAG: hypothetical protein PHX47_04525 [Candidatus ainarchaeum sp.]|jgi:hypothetical protein|nr:hypothetical protein [Candidatus ainarchaeum sp.]